MTDDDTQELLETGAAALDDIVAEAVREDLAGERGDGDAGALALEDIAEVLKIGVAAADTRGAELEGGDVCAADDLVVGVHAATHAMGSRVADLFGGEMSAFVRCQKIRGTGCRQSGVLDRNGRDG